MSWLSNLVDDFKAWIAKAENEAKKLKAEIPVIESETGTAIHEVADVVAQIAPKLAEIDAFIAPTLKSAKATSANASALAILSKVSQVAQSVSALTSQPTPPAQ